MKTAARISSVTVLTLLLLQAQPALAGGATTFRCSERFGTNCEAEIPDNDEDGVTSSFAFPTQFCDTEMQDLNVQVEIEHPYPGDLTVVLSYQATLLPIIDRPGFIGPEDPYPGPISFGCSADDLFVTLDDEADEPIGDTCSPLLPGIQGKFQPANPLSLFDGLAPNGVWTLIVRDNAGGDSSAGLLLDWALTVDCTIAVPVSPWNTVFSIVLSLLVLGILALSGARLLPRRTRERR